MDGALGQRAMKERASDLDQALGDPNAVESSGGEDENDAEEAAAGDAVSELLANGPATEDTVRQMLELEAKQMRTVERLRRRKRRLRARLAAYQRKEMEFVAQMDSHMDEVERTEHALTQRIEQLTAESQQLRTFTDKRANDNANLAERLAETTKQCSESETRVQFLVDRIVALLSAASADPEQTQAIVEMRQRERDMLKHLEEARQQYDEVRQQNSDLTSRLTEELALSRRLSDQLAEVEERFFHHRPEQSQQMPVLAPESPPRASGRFGPRPLGFRSDQLEDSAQVSGPRGLPAQAPPDIPRGSRDVEPGRLHAEASGHGELSRPSPLGVVPETGPPLLSEEADDDGSGGSGGSGGAGGDTQHVPWRRSASAQSVLLMEEKLRDALDRAAFECAVVRVETGIYEFGPSRALVELTPSGEVIASEDGENFEPIDSFILGIASETQEDHQEDHQAPESDAAESSPLRGSQYGEAEEFEASAGSATLPQPPSSVAMDPARLWQGSCLAAHPSQAASNSWWPSAGSGTQPVSLPARLGGAQLGPGRVPSPARVPHQAQSKPAPSSPPRQASQTLTPRGYMGVPVSVQAMPGRSSLLTANATGPASMAGQTRHQGVRMATSPPLVRQWALQATTGHMQAGHYPQ